MSQCFIEFSQCSLGFFIDIYYELNRIYVMAELVRYYKRRVSINSVPPV